MDSLQALHSEILACCRCLEAGYSIAPGPVFGSGSERQVMLIGQAPGVTEAEVKRPFNANSGKRLFQWLGQAGWAEDEFRARHTMTAVTKCYPGKDPKGKGDRVPSKTEQAFCRPFLEREITLINPRLMILVGGLAIKLFFPARAKLEDVVGTAVYFPPETFIDPLNFNLADSIPITPENLQSLISQSPNLSPHGRFIIPLPHPSGASLWPNKPENQARIAKALQTLHDIRVVMDL